MMYDDLSHSSRLQALQHQDMDTQQRHREIAAGAVGGARDEIAMRDQQQSPDQKIFGSRAFHHGTLEWNYCSPRASMSLVLNLVSFRLFTRSSFYSCKTIIK